MPSRAARTTSSGAAEITQKSKRWPSMPWASIVLSELLGISGFPEQVGELRALLHQVQAGERRDLLAEARDAEQLAQNDAGIVEAERLVEVARQQVLLLHWELLKKKPLHRSGAGRVHRATRAITSASTRAPRAHSPSLVAAIRRTVRHARIVPRGRRAGQPGKC